MTQEQCSAFAAFILFEYVWKRNTCNERDMRRTGIWLVEILHCVICGTSSELYKLVHLRHYEFVTILLFVSTYVHVTSNNPYVQWMLKTCSFTTVRACLDRAPTWQRRAIWVRSRRFFFLCAAVDEPGRPATGTRNEDAAASNIRWSNEVDLSNVLLMQPTYLAPVIPQCLQKTVFAAMHACRLFKLTKSLHNVVTSWMKAYVIWRAKFFNIYTLMLCVVVDQTLCEL